MVDAGKEQVVVQRAQQRRKRRTVALEGVANDEVLEVGIIEGSEKVVDIDGGVVLVGGDDARVGVGVDVVSDSGDVVVAVVDVVDAVDVVVGVVVKVVVGVVIVIVNADANVEVGSIGVSVGCAVRWEIIVRCYPSI